MKHFIFILAALLFTCSAANAQGLTDARKQVKDITRSAGEDSLSYKLNSKYYSVHIGQQDTLRIISDDTVVVDTLTGGKYILCNSQDTVKLYLNYTVGDRELFIKKLDTATLKPIIITPLGSGATIDGAGTLSITTQYRGYYLKMDATTRKWYVVSNQ